MINGVEINCDKTFFIDFNLSRYVNLNISCFTSSNYKKIILKHAESIKYLGIHFDNNCKWKTHIQSVVKKIRKRSYINK